jgi:hypothetical protein
VRNEIDGQSKAVLRYLFIYLFIATILYVFVPGCAPRPKPTLRTLLPLSAQVTYSHCSRRKYLTCLRRNCLAYPPSLPPPLLRSETAHSGQTLHSSPSDPSLRQPDWHACFQGHHVTSNKLPCRPTSTRTSDVSHPNPNPNNCLGFPAGTANNLESPTPVPATQVHQHPTQPIDTSPQARHLTSIAIPGSDTV